MKKIIFILILPVVLNINVFSQWVQIGDGLNGTVRTLTPRSFLLYAGGDFTSSGNEFTGRVARWDGTSWDGTDTINPFNSSVHALHYQNNGSLLYAGGHFSQRILSYYFGWRLVGNVLNEDVNAITSIGNDVYAGGSFTWAGNNPLHFIGKWNGSSWSELDTGLNATVSALAVIGNNLYVGGSFYKTYAGMDLKRIAMWNGHWNQLGTGIPSGWVNALAVDGNDLYVAGTFSLVVSNGVAHNIAKWNGSSWSMVGTPLAPGLNDEITSLAVSGGVVYAGGYFTSTHGGNVSVNHIAKWDGISWQPIGAGFNAPVRSLCIYGNYLYAGGDFLTSGTTSVRHIAKWSTPIGIQQIGNEIPVKHSLLQNYPNPFNPSTKFRFSIAETEEVTITVYEIKGKIVEKLVNEKLNAGSYEVEWNASKLSSGTYFYRMQTGRFTETKKMILIK